MKAEASQDLTALQIQREKDSLKLGLERLRQTTNLGTFQRQFLDGFLAPLTKVIVGRQQEIGVGKTKGTAQFALAALPAEELAFITLATVMFTIADSRQDSSKPSQQAEATLRRTSMRIGQLCMQQFMAAIESEQTDSNGSTDIELQLRSVLASRQSNKWNAAKRTDETIDAMRSADWWNVSRQIALGGELVHLAIVATGLFRKTYKSLGADSAKRTAVLNLTDRGAYWLEERRRNRQQYCDDAGILAIPINLPMVCPPQQWHAFKSGGYMTAKAALIKPNPENLVKVDEYDLGGMRAVTTAIDSLQQTSWKINNRVFESYQRCWDNISFRAKLFGGGGFSNEQIASVETKIAIIQSLARMPFYFPFQLDFRGRVYPIPHVVNNQSDDATKALLQFASPAVRTDDSEYWTAIQLANSYGHNKLALNDRYTWVYNHRSEIEKLVKDPTAEIEFWSEAEEPWGMLAAAYEWIEILNGARETYLPIHVDGKCNGLQHLSAMSRDLDAGRAVNLVPSDKPEDIYETVARRVTDAIAGDNGSDAKFWSNKVNRALVKRPVMTTPYGVTAEGIRQQLKEAAQRHYPDSSSISYLATKVIGAIEDIMHGPSAVKWWLQRVAKAMSKGGEPLAWTTPSGFKVIQNYRKPEVKRMSVEAFSVEFYLPVDESRPINARKQELAVVANLVHSLDAAHLIATINKLCANGVNHIAVVHDSYGVHAKHVPLMNRLIREAFVEIYREPVLDRFIEEQSAASKLDLPAFDTYGKLDIDKVLESKYFFS